MLYRTVSEHRLFIYAPRGYTVVKYQYGMKYEYEYEYE